MLLAGVAGPGAAQGHPPGAADIRYTPAQLDCAHFAERSRGTLDAQTGGRRRRETLRRDGLWVLRATAGADGSIALEAWLDSLALARESPEGTLTPDTDGLLGGRYRGTLTPSGSYLGSVRPFIPDEVAEVAELGGALDDLLPPLPPRTLAVGAVWRDSTGLEIRRLPDSAGRGAAIHRLAIHVRRTADQATVRGDTTEVPAKQATVEDGEVDWGIRTGLLRRRRQIVVESEVPAGGLVRVPLRSRLEQTVTLERVAGSCEPVEGSP